MSWSQFFLLMSMIMLAPHMSAWAAIGFGALYMGLFIHALREESK
jgi:hypothetical protein